MSDAQPLTIEILVNGERHRALAGQSVVELLRSLEIASERVAVELNRVILKKDLWPSTMLQGGEQIEIVHFVGGG